MCTASNNRREIDPSRVKETGSPPIGDKLITQMLLVVLECWKDRAIDSADCLRSFVIVHSSLCIRSSFSCGMLTKVCRARINYFELSCFLHYPPTL